MTGILRRLRDRISAVDLGAAAAACAVCGRRGGRAWYKSQFGDVWCSDHTDLPNCPFCAVPAHGPAGSLCKRCSADTVRTRSELDAALRQVGTHMAGIGLVIDPPTQIVLRDRADLTNRGLLASPHALGGTRWTHDQRGRLTGKIVIGIVAGLPAAQCQAVIAHEFGHALLADGRGSNSLADKVNEGFCEALAARYLERRPSSRDVKIALDKIQNNPDPVYGDGYRVVAPAIQRWGEPYVLASLREGAVGRIGVRA